jgi:hypothetical protein
LLANPVHQAPSSSLIYRFRQQAGSYSGSWFILRFQCCRRHARIVPTTMHAAITGLGNVAMPISLAAFHDQDRNS